MMKKNSILRFGDYDNEGYSFAGYKRYLISHPWSMITTAFFLLLGFGQKMLSNTFSIDTQSLIQVPNDLYGSWFELNRFMLVALKKVTGTSWYNNALASFLMVILFGAATTVWGYALYCAPSGKKINPIYFMVPLVVSPIMAEQLGFLLQAPEICIGLIAIAVALMLLQNTHSSHYRLYIILAVLLAAFAFSLYAAMVTIFIAAVAMIFVLKYREYNRFKPFMANYIVVNAIACILAYTIYVVVNKIVLAIMHLQVNAYITEQSRWGKDSFSTIAHSLLSQMYNMYTGKGIYYSAIFTFLITLSISLMIYRLVRKEVSFVLVIIYIAICISPMLMPTLLGGTASIRTEMTYPWSFAFVVMFTAAELLHFHVSKIVTLLLLACIGFNQGFISNRIFYTESVIYNQDVALANAVANRIGIVSGKEIPDVPVVFIGSHSARCNNDCYTASQLELVGRSLFEITFSTQHGTWVKNQFMGVQGFQYQLPSNDQMKNADKLATGMPQWPAEGSVSMQNGYIIVKF
ncbi:glucosyl transferase GtrII [Bifidobacterium reuteri]|uniref:Glucosyl transferase GtrII n=1 Tax=Bifidobacterium reuteri TaxID=983706 RepID=A0A5J5E8X8_9BIFI|nr:glucosyltransferase domain-containing protein [Bifidobacterium reuteri]KAA8825481.1 glucosyl transferase GtrII [Bifidobacterium reuteri]